MKESIYPPISNPLSLRSLSSLRCIFGLYLPLTIRRRSPPLLHHHDDSITLYGTPKFPISFQPQIAPSVRNRPRSTTRSFCRPLRNLRVAAEGTLTGAPLLLLLQNVLEMAVLLLHEWKRICLRYMCGIDGLMLFSVKRTKKLAGTLNWGTTTVVGVFAGMLYGGSKEASASVSSRRIRTRYAIRRSRSSRMTPGSCMHQVASAGNEINSVRSCKEKRLSLKNGIASRETGALKEAKDKLEKQVEDLSLRLQLEKHRRFINECVESYCKLSNYTYTEPRVCVNRMRTGRGKGGKSSGNSKIAAGLRRYAKQNG
ncbi:myosin [Striga asiatica]|uniref:Myosin n=1 Tax=Striga asiatica TaxID=4170 RepID=A0A5A7Q0P4_STRAF|nr:myosin [Striga asiatica]